MCGSRQWQLIDKEFYFEHVTTEKLIENLHGIRNSHELYNLEYVTMAQARNQD